MSNVFVWFHNSSQKPGDSTAFYAALLGWKHSEGPGGATMFVDEKEPFAAVGADDGALGWIPYAQVDDVAAATQTARALGATVIKEPARGPAGEFSVVRDPGGAAIALWQKA